LLEITKKYQTAPSHNYRLQLQSHVIQSPECLSSVSELRAHRICTRQLHTSNSCTSTPTENWTHVYMNSFTRNSPYYHLLKYLLFLLKHPVYALSSLNATGMRLDSYKKIWWISLIVYVSKTYLPADPFWFRKI